MFKISWFLGRRRESGAQIQYFFGFLKILILERGGLSVLSMEMNEEKKVETELT